MTEPSECTRMVNWTSGVSTAPSPWLGLPISTLRSAESPVFLKHILFQSIFSCEVVMPVIMWCPTYAICQALFLLTDQWLVRCQSYEGGFGGVPGMEAHGGYSFCGLAALMLMGKVGRRGGAGHWCRRGCVTWRPWPCGGRTDRCAWRGVSRAGQTNWWTAATVSGRGASSLCSTKWVFIYCNWRCSCSFNLASPSDAVRVPRPQCLGLCAPPLVVRQPGPAGIPPCMLSGMVTTDLGLPTCTLPVCPSLTFLYKCTCLKGRLG